MPLDTYYYDVLEIPPTASINDIKKAYRRQAIKWHPVSLSLVLRFPLLCALRTRCNIQDKNVDNSETATEMFKLIAEAYSILSDPKKRQVYDIYGREGIETAPSPPQGAKRANGGPFVRPPSVSMQFASDIFESFFGRAFDDFFSDPFFSPISSTFPRLRGFRSPFSDMLIDSPFGPSLFSDPFEDIPHSSFSSMSSSAFSSFGGGQTRGASSQSITTYENGVPVTHTTRTVFNPDGTSTTTTTVQRGNAPPHMISDNHQSLRELQYR